jgi:hypothetical protein
VPTKKHAETALLQGAQDPPWLKSQSDRTHCRSGKLQSPAMPGILDPLQDATFIFTTDLHGMITGCNQPADSRRSRSMRLLAGRT